MTVFHLPDLGEGLHEAEIVAWHVVVGQRVVSDQPLVSVETDKAVVEIPSPQAGNIVKLHGQPGDRLAVGAPLVEFDQAARDTGAIVGELAPTPPAGRPEGEPPRARAVAKAASAGSAGERVKATPAVRALAKELGVDLAGVEPSGAEGQVTREDIQRAAAALSRGMEGYEPVHGLRRAMAKNMARSGAAVVPATVTDEADVDAWPAGTDVTARLVRALVAACAAEPALNAWFDGETLARRLHHAVHVGIATDTPEGLVVPVLREAQTHELAGLRGALDELKRAAHDRTAAPEALRGATITLSNFGTLGGRHGVLVIVPPQVAILGAGRAAPQVVVLDGKPAVRRRLPLSLTFDHRAVTGGEAARFLAAVIGDLGRPD